MATTRVFKSGNSHAVHLPEEMAFEEGQELTITRNGEAVTLFPKRDSLRQVLEEFLAAPPLERSEPLERMQLPDRGRS
jgi:antitoxin VapB